MDKIDFSEFVARFSYDPKNGFITDINRNKIVKSKNAGGYLTLHFKGKNYYVHRMGWALTHNYFPNSAIDHINGNRADNRICNLRLVTSSENAHNRRNTMGYTKPKQTKKWSASIVVNKKRKHLGYFDTKEMAHFAYLEAKKIYHPSAPHY